MALPPEVREPAITALHDGRVGYERAMTEQLAAGRQAQDTIQELADNPQFQEFLRGGVNPQPASQPAAPQPGGKDLNSLYGENAASYLDDIADRVVQKMGGQFDGLSQTVQNMQRGFAQNEFEVNWNALTERAKAQGLPDPKINESSIRMIMTQNPALTLDQAYAATVDVMNLPARQPLETSPKQPAQPTIPPAAGALPGQNNGPAVATTGLETVDHEQAAMQARKEGTNLNPVDAIKAAFAKATEARNQVNGTSIVPDDL